MSKAHKKFVNEINDIRKRILAAIKEAVLKVEPTNDELEGETFHAVQLLEKSSAIKDNYTGSNIITLVGVNSEGELWFGGENEEDAESFECVGTEELDCMFATDTLPEVLKQVELALRK